MYSNSVPVMASITATRIGSGMSIVAQFGENELIHPALTEPIGANEGIDGHALLSQPPGILQCGGGRLDTLHGDVVAQRVQDGVHVSLDAGSEQLHKSGIAAQLGDLVLESAKDVRRHGCQPSVQPVGGFGDVAAHLDIGVDVRFRHHSRR